MSTNSYLTIKREVLLKALQVAFGVVERRHTMQILSNLLFATSTDKLAITGTDLEIQLTGIATLNNQTEELPAITLPARKIMDICRTLPEDSTLQINYANAERVVVTCGRSRFTLGTLPAHDFPKAPLLDNPVHFSINQSLLKTLLEKTYFTISQQSSHNYLNGLLLEIDPDKISAVAADGHRMAICTSDIATNISHAQQVIIPRKSVLELMRLLEHDDGNLTMLLTSNLIQLYNANFELSSKLIAGKFPNYGKSVPKGLDKQIVLNRNLLKQTIMRVAILSNEIFRTVRFKLQDNILQLFTSNPDQEEAVEEIELDDTYAPLEIIFNITYLLDILNNLSAEKVIFNIKNSETGTLIEEESKNTDRAKCIYILMPIRK